MGILFQGNIFKFFEILSSFDNVYLNNFIRLGLNALKKGFKNIIKFHSFTIHFDVSLDNKII